MPRSPVGIRQLPVTSMPWVRVSTPLVKYCTPPIPVTPASASSASVASSSNVAPRMMRSSMSMWNTSAVTVRLSIGVKARPALRLIEVSSLSGWAPSASAAGSSTGKIPTSTNWSAITLVTTLLNDTWLRPGRPEAGARGAPEHHPL